MGELSSFQAPILSEAGNINTSYLLRIDKVHGISERNVGRKTIASENVLSYNVHTEQ